MPASESTPNHFELVTGPEASIVARAQAGDRSSLDELLRSQQPRIYAVCRRMVGNEADALDATQDTLIAIVRGLDRFDGRAKFSTWAHRIAVNCCLDELRRRSRRPTPGLPATRSVEPSDSGRVENQVSARIDVDAALQAIAPEFRAAVVLRDLCSLDYAEIAIVLDIPAGTVRSRIARGRAAMAEHLSGNHEPLNHRQSH